MTDNEREKKMWLVVGGVLRGTLDGIYTSIVDVKGEGGRGNKRPSFSWDE